MRMEITECSQEWENALVEGYKPGDTLLEGLAACPIVEGLRVERGNRGYVDIEYLIGGMWLARCHALLCMKSYYKGWTTGMNGLPSERAAIGDINKGDGNAI